VGLTPTEQKCATYAPGYNHHNLCFTNSLVPAKFNNVYSTFVHSEDVVGTGHGVVWGHSCGQVHAFGARMLKHNLAANLAYSSSPSSSMQISQSSLAPSAGRTSSSGEFCLVKTIVSDSQWPGSASLSAELAPQGPVALASTAGRVHAQQPHSYRRQGWKG
jgi:hypothetical protein